MSDQPGIPAFTVFPPFNPAPRQSEPAPEPPRDEAPAAPAEPEPAAAAPEPAEAPAWDAPAPPEAAAWDFEAPAAPREEAPETPMMEDEDLPWLEVPEPRPGAGEPEEIKAEDGPNWMDWVRSEETPADAPQPEDAQPWAPEVENAADDWASETPAEPWRAPADEAAADPWRAPADEAPADPWRAPADEPAADAWQPPADEAPAADPWSAPAAEPEPGIEAAADTDTGLELPDEELYDLPDVPAGEPRSAAPWSEAEAPLFEPAADQAAEEPAWELPSQPAAEAPAADVSGAFGEVADQLQRIADALRADPAAFMAGAQGGGDPLGLLVAGFVLGYNARPRNR